MSEVETLLTDAPPLAPIAEGEAVRVDGYIPSVAGTCIAIDGGEAWVRWPNGTSSIVRIKEMRRAL
jgi:hypothetical protein